MEEIIMTVEKFIRILGYIGYVALWAPVIVLTLIVIPLWVAAKTKSIPVTGAVIDYGLKAGLNHDRKFIETGVWE
jgi:hypothetical protein